MITILNIHQIKIKNAILIPIDNTRAKLRIGNSLLTLKGGYDLVINLDVLYQKLKDENAALKASNDNTHIHFR